MPRRPVSVLVTVITRDLHVLLLKRTRPFDFWQSVTGSLRDGESHDDAARRELIEETGLTEEGVLEYSGVSRQFVIDARWRDRFERGVIENVEFEWRYTLDRPLDVAINQKEHSEHQWLPLSDAIERVWSWTNRAAFEALLR